MNFILSITHESPTPIYRQIADQIIAAIRSGDLKTGQRLLPIRSMATQLSVNPSTVARAFQELERDGYIEAAGPNGSFVKETGESSETDSAGDAPEWKLDFKKAVAAAVQAGAQPSELIQLVLDSE